MTTTAWAHLPNAPLIDWVLADVRARPRVWAAARDAARDAARAAARTVAWAAAQTAARAAARDAVRTAARAAARDAAWDAARDAAWDALFALIAWDDAGPLLDAPPETFVFLLKMEQPAALLLQPAYLVRHNLEQLP